MKKACFLLLNIYTIFSLNGFAQNLQLKISGKTSVDNAIIDSLVYKVHHEDLLSLKNEVDTIQKKLYRIGFIENQLHELTKENDSAYFAKIFLNSKYKEIHIFYDEKRFPKEILKQVSKKVYDNYFTVSFPEIENKLYLLNQTISDLGFPFSEIKLKNITVKNSNTLQAFLDARAVSEKRNIDKIVIKGYTKFPKAYLKHYLKIKPNTVFNLSKIKTKTKSLNQLRFANQIKEPEVLFTKDSTLLYLYIEKVKSNNFDGFLGFGSNEKTDKIEFNGYLNLNLNNNLNAGEAFNLIYKSVENEQKTFQAKLNLPYLFNSPLGAEFGLDIFKRDSTFSTVNQIAKLFYIFNPQISIYAGIKNTKSNNLLDSETSFSNVQDFKANLYNVRFLFEKRQNSRLFRTNSLIDFEVGTGNRSFAMQTENQTQLALDAYKIFNLNPKNSAYIRFNGAGIFSETYLENELLRFGGINSIRGFEENSLYASLYGLVNTEYRYQLNQGIYLHSIIDISYLENETQNLKERLYGFGFGFGLATKAGLLRFNYANGKNENQKFKLSNSKIHLSLTAFF